MHACTVAGMILNHSIILPRHVAKCHDCHMYMAWLLPCKPMRAQWKRDGPITCWINRCTRPCYRCVQHLYVPPTIHHRSRSWHQCQAHACGMPDSHASHNTQPAPGWMQTSTWPPVPQRRVPLNQIGGDGGARENAVQSHKLLPHQRNTRTWLCEPEHVTARLPVGCVTH